MINLREYNVIISKGGMRWNGLEGFIGVRE